jgi:carbonic anhydrase
MPIDGRFAAVITCMDGRIQTRTIDQVMTRFGARYVDNITSTGAVQHLDGQITATGEGLLQSLAVSEQAHGTKQVALVAHAGCAGNPVSDDTQKEQLRKARAVVSERFPGMEIIALFFDPRLGFEKIG